MKKLNYLKRFAIVAALSLGLSCSSDEGAPQNDQNAATVENAQSEATPPGKDKDELTSRLCREGFHFEVFSEFELNLFKGMRTCTSGFGACFGTSIKITFDCVRNAPLAAPQNAQFYPSTNSADVYIRQLDGGNLKIYLPAAVTRSASNVPSDFEYFDTDSVVWDGVKLVRGRYPRVVEGNFFTYTVKFTR